VRPISDPDEKENLSRSSVEPDLFPPNYVLTNAADSTERASALPLSHEH